MAEEYLTRFINIDDDDDLEGIEVLGDEETETEEEEPKDDEKTEKEEDDEEEE